MAITQAPARVRIESAAKNGTLGSQASLGNKQIKFDTNISTNNGNLVASPVFTFRHVIIRRGDSDEESNYITSVDVDGVTCTCIDDWDSNPVSGDTYDVSYGLDDVATFAGCTKETDSLQFAMDSARRLVVGDATNFAFLGMGNGQVLRLSDQGPTTKGMLIKNAGRWEIGAQKNDSARRGSVVITTHNGAGEDAIEFESGSRGVLADVVFLAAENPNGIRNEIIVNALADVTWIRMKQIGIDSPFSNTYKRFKIQVTDVLLATKSEIMATPEMSGWLRGDFEQTIKDELASFGNGARVRLLIEEDS